MLKLAFHLLSPTNLQRRRSLCSECIYIQFVAVCQDYWLDGWLASPVTWPQLRLPERSETPVRCRYVWLNPVVLRLITFYGTQSHVQCPHSTATFFFVVTCCCLANGAIQFRCIQPLSLNPHSLLHWRICRLSARVCCQRGNQLHRSLCQVL